MASHAKGQSPKNQQIKKTDGTGALPWYALAGIVILTVLVYSGSLSREFVSLDDPHYITANPHIKSLSFSSIIDIFSTFYNANYHPLTTLLFAIQYQLFGNNAAPYHAVSVLLHLVNTCLVFFFLEKLSARRAVALIGTLLFAIHPLHVESVAWVSEQKDLLYTLFLLGGLIVYLKYIATGNGKYAATVFILFFLSLLSKSAAVIFPLLMLTIDYYQRREWSVKILTEKIPFFLLSLAFGVVTILSQQSAGAIATEMIPPYDPVQRFFVVCYALVYYIVKLIVPAQLSAMHYAPKELEWYYYVCPLIIALLAIGIWKTRTLKRELVFGFLFYLCAIILVVQIIPVGYAVVAERYSYVPYIGLFFIAGMFYVQVVECNMTLAIRKYLRYALAGVIVVFAALSFQRIQVWQNGVTLFRDVVEKYPNEAAGHFSLGKAEAGAGDTTKALLAYTESIRLKPDYAEVFYYRGIIYNLQKKNELALKDYSKTLELKPDHAEAAFNTAVLYTQIGKNEEAIPYFTKAIAVHPHAKAYNGRGNAYFYLKQYQEALNDYNEAAQLDSVSGEAFYNLGAAYYYLQQPAEACTQWKKASVRGYKQAAELLNVHCK